MSKKPTNHSTPNQLPKVAVIGTGGTISSIGRSRLDLVDYGEGRKMQVEELLASVPELSEVARIHAVPFFSVGSRDVGPSQWLALLNLIHETVRSDPEIA